MNGDGGGGLERGGGLLLPIEVGVVAVMISSDAYRDVHVGLGGGGGTTTALSSVWRKRQFIYLTPLLLLFNVIVICY